MSTTPDHSIRSWPWAQVQECLRMYGAEIGLLAQRGDALAIKVKARYQYAHDHPNDINANSSLRDALTEYLQRDLMDRERTELGSKFGHLIDSSKRSAPQIVVPAGVRKH